MKGFSLVELIVVLVIIGIIFAVLFGAVGCPTGVMPNYSEGVRIGELYKCSQKGIVFKSWEGELKLSDFNLQNNMGNVWSFSVKDDVLGREIESLIGQKLNSIISNIW